MVSRTPVTALMLFSFLLTFHPGVSVSQEINKRGEEFHINTYTAGNQEMPAVACLPDGGFVVVWQSDGQDGSGNGIYGQRFDSDGDPVGDEFQVNTHTTDGQQWPEAAALSSGGFVVVWHSYGQDGDDAGVYGQRFDSDGNTAGNEFRANKTTEGYQCCTSVAGLSNGGFVVAWTDEEQYGWDNCMGQLYDGNGNKVGGEFRINSTTNQSQIYPSVAPLPDGGFVAAWQSTQTGNAQIFAQRFNSSAGKVGNEFLVSESRPVASNASAAPLWGGGFVVSWTGGDEFWPEPDIYAQIFDASGNKVGGNLEVNTYQYNQGDSSVAGLTGGGFVVTWMSHDQDGSYWGIFDRVLDVSGTKVGDEFQVNTYSQYYQMYPSAGSLSGGGFVVTWYSTYTQEGTGLGSGVYGQLFDACLDSDDDDYPASECGGTDCNDDDPSVNPAATEICQDEKDNNCDSLTDCEDPDCFEHEECIFVDMKSAVLSLQACAGLEFVSEPSARQLDVNHDGRLTIEDTIFILQVFAGLRE